MPHAPGLYIAGVAASATAIVAAERALPIGAVVTLAIVAPIGPVLVGWLLTQRKLRQQDHKVEEIHVLVNSRLSKTLDALQDALLESVRLKAKVGEPLTHIEAEVATGTDVAVVLADQTPPGINAPP